MNPYQPPSPDAEGPAPAATEVQPLTSVFSLLGRALSLFFGNLATIAPITLVVFVPVEIIKNYVVYSTNVAGNFSVTSRIETLIEGVFGPLVTAAILVALSHKIRTGRDLGVREALSQGAKRWGAVFGARFRSGLFIALGVLLLVVPALVWMVKYALTDEIATLEVPRSATRVMNRSGELVRGHAWKVFGVGLLATLGVFTFQFVGGLVAGVADVWIVTALIDSVNDVTYRFFAVVFLLVYLGIMKGRGEASEAIES